MDLVCGWFRWIWHRELGLKHLDPAINLLPKSFLRLVDRSRDLLCRILRFGNVELCGRFVDVVPRLMVEIRHVIEPLLRLFGHEQQLCDRVERDAALE